VFVIDDSLIPVALITHQKTAAIKHSNKRRTCQPNESQPNVRANLKTPEQTVLLFF
jgi:hypothetical protein